MCPNAHIDYIQGALPLHTRSLWPNRTCCQYLPLLVIDHSDQSCGSCEQEYRPGRARGLSMKAINQHIQPAAPLRALLRNSNGRTHRAPDKFSPRLFGHQECSENVPDRQGVSLFRVPGSGAGRTSIVRKYVYAPGTRRAAGTLGAPTASPPPLAPARARRPRRPPCASRAPRRRGPAARGSGSPIRIIRWP